MRFELLTPPGVGGVAVVAVRGADRVEVLKGWLRAPGSDEFRPDPERPGRAILAPAGVPLDEVLVIDRPQLDRLELHLHGSVAVIAELRSRGQIATAAAADGLAEAHLRAHDLLLHATSAEQLALALEQVAMPRLADWLAEVGAEPSRASQQVEWARLVERSVVAVALAEPAPLHLIGRQNAGKSTLLNRLVLAERALTGDLPGLTRDGVREQVELDGYPYRVSDTAGHGAAADSLDRAAIERGAAAARDGLRILVVDAEVGWGDVERRLAPTADLVVWSRRDRRARPAAWPECEPLGPGFDLRDPEVALQVRAQVGGALRRIRGLPEAPADGVGGVVAWTARELARARQVLAPDEEAPSG